MSPASALTLPANPSISGVSRRLWWALLIALTLTTFALRWPTRAEPLDRDHLVYAVVAREMLQGRPLLSDLWDIKPPGIYVAYAGAQWVGGYGRASIFWMGVALALGTLAGVAAVVRQCTRDDVAALWAGLFWVVAACNLPLQANQPNTEAFLNLAFIAGLWAFVRGVDLPSGRVLSWCAVVGAGLLFGVGALFKQVAFCTPVSLGLWLLWARANPLRLRLLSVLGLTLPTAALWAGLFGYFALTGRGALFWWTTFDYGRQYAAEGARLNAATPWAVKLFPQAMWSLSPLWLLILGAAWGGRAFLAPRLVGALALCALGVQIAIILPQGFFAHYYQLWLPLASVAAGVALSALRRREAATSPGGRWKGSVVGAGVAALSLLALQGQTALLSPRQASLFKYHDPLFADMPAAARRLDAILKPDETFYQYGYDPGFYFYTGRRPPVGTVCLGLSTLPLPSWFQERLVADLRRTRPDVVILDTSFPPSRVTRFVRQNYAPLPGDVLRLPPMQLWARRDSRLAKAAY